MADDSMLAQLRDEIGAIVHELRTHADEIDEAVENRPTSQLAGPAKSHGSFVRKLAERLQLAVESAALPANFPVVCGSCGKTLEGHTVDVTVVRGKVVSIKRNKCPT